MAYINQIDVLYSLPILANTKKALTIGEYAKSIGKGDAYVHAMWKAYMQDSRNISLLLEIKNTVTIGRKSCCPVPAISVRKGSAHSIINTVDEDLILMTVVIERSTL